MERGEREKEEANKSWVSPYALCEDIFNVLDFIEELNNEEDQIPFNMDQFGKLKLDLTFMLTAILQLPYSDLDGFNDKISRKAQQVDVLVQSLFHQSGEDMLVKLKDHVIPRLLEYVKTYMSSDYHSKSSLILTENQLDELLDVLLKNLHHLSNCCAKLMFPSMTQYKFLQNVCGNLRDFHWLKVKGFIEHEIVEKIGPQFQLTAERVGRFCFDIFSCQFDNIDESDELEETDEADECDETNEINVLDESDETNELDEADETDETDDLDETDETNETNEILCQLNSKLAHLLVKIVPVELEVMHLCSTNLKASKSVEVGRFIEQLYGASPDILREYLVNLKEHMITVIIASTSARRIHVMIEFLMIIVADLPKDTIHHEKKPDLLARVVTLIREVSTNVQDFEENSRNEERPNEKNCGSLDLLESIEHLKGDLKNVFLKAPEDSPQLYFPKSDGPLFMTLLFRHLTDLLDSDACSVALIKEEIRQVKEGLVFIRSFFGKVEQESNGDLWIYVLAVAYGAEQAINSILVMDNGLMQLIFVLPDIIGKIQLLKKELQENISKSRDFIVANSPNKPVESTPSTKLIVGFEEETNMIIRQLTSGLAGLDVISIIGMPGSGKTTLAYKVYNDKWVTSHFDICAWCTIDQRYDRIEVLKNLYKQVTGSTANFSVDMLQRKLYGGRYLIVLDDLWDIAAWDELTMPFPDFKNKSRIILTSRENDVASHVKRHSDPLNLRLLRPNESFELLQNRVFGGSRCPNELLDVGKKIVDECKGLPLTLDLIGGVIAKEKGNKSFWLEVADDLSSFVLEDDHDAMKVVQLSYDHLSDRLKPCLLYLATSRKDYEFRLNKLEDLWKGEGLVELIKSVKEVYVDGLVSSSLLLVTKERGEDEPKYKIHDLVHDFCSIKAEEEKLFEYFTSAPSFSSEVMRRSRMITQDLDADFFKFNVEKQIPYAKHLLSLMVDLDSFTNDCHLRHLRLLRRLELRGILLTNSLVNEIGLLVHLRFLEIETEAKTLPLSFSNLLNLETLKVGNWGCSMVLSPTIWRLAKLRDVRMDGCSLVDRDKPVGLEEDSKLENLTRLEELHLSSWDMEDVFKRFPNLESLKFKIEGDDSDSDSDSDSEICFPRLDVLSKLECVMHVVLLSHMSGIFTSLTA